jgi:hypothetical protein
MSLPIPPEVAAAVAELGPSVVESVVDFVTAIANRQVTKARSAAGVAVARMNKRTTEIALEASFDAAAKRLRK